MGTSIPPLRGKGEATCIDERIKIPQRLLGYFVFVLSLDKQVDLPAIAYGFKKSEEELISILDSLKEYGAIDYILSGQQVQIEIKKSFYDFQGVIDPKDAYNFRDYDRERNRELLNQAVSPDYILDSPTEKDFYQIRNLVSDDARIAETKLNLLSYQDFLRTPYWKAISYMVKKNAGFQCALCVNKSNLQAHHRTYEHKGSEILHLGDLVCLCGDCHEKFHSSTNE